MNKAAEVLFISQPLLTNAINESEREVGINIFLRTSKGVSETNEGAAFLIYAVQVYRQYAQVDYCKETTGNYGME